MIKITKLGGKMAILVMLLGTLIACTVTDQLEQPLTQPTNLPTNPPTDPPTNQPTNEPAPQPTAEPERPLLNLPDQGEAPEIHNEVWINTDGPVTLADSRGKVVLLEFWTFG